MTHPSALDKSQNKTRLTNYLEENLHKFKQSLFLDISTDTIKSQEFRETVKTIEKEAIPSQPVYMPNQLGQYTLVNSPPTYSLRESEEVINTVSIPAVSYYPDESIELLKQKIKDFIGVSIQQAYSETHKDQQTDLTDFIDRQIKSFETSLSLLCSKTTVCYNGLPYQVMPVNDFQQRLDMFFANFCDNIATNIEEFVQSQNPMDQTSQLPLVAKFTESQREIVRLKEELDESKRQSQQEIEKLKEELDESKRQSQQEIEKLKEEPGQSKDQIGKLIIADQQLTKSNERLDQSKASSDLSSLSKWLPATDTDSYELSTILSSDALEKGKASSASNSNNPNQQKTESGLQEQIDKTRELLYIVTENQEKFSLLLQNLSTKSTKSSFDHQIKVPIPGSGDQSPVVITPPNQQGDHRVLPRQIPKESDRDSERGKGGHTFISYVPSEGSAFRPVSSSEDTEVARLLSTSPKPAYVGGPQAMQPPAPQPPARPQPFQPPALQPQAMQPQAPQPPAPQPQAPQLYSEIDQSIIKYKQQFGNIFVLAKYSNETYFIVFLDIKDQSIKIHKLGFVDLKARDDLNSDLIEFCKKKENKNVSFEKLKGIIIQNNRIELGQNFEEVKGNDRQAMLKNFFEKYQKLELDRRGDVPGFRPSRREIVRQGSQEDPRATKVDQSRRAEPSIENERGLA
jgi:hypothetical protein